MKDYIAVTAREHNLFIRCANAIAGKDLSPAASVMLLATARVLGDLRVCEWAGGNGYALQAEAIAATVHELAYSAAYIADSDERAEGWLKHQNEKRQYPESGHASVLDAVIQRLGLGKAHAKQEYTIYRQLCLAKHGNPVVQRLHGMSDENGARLIEQLPYFDHNTMVLARFGLFHAARAVAALLTTLLATHLAETLSAETFAEFSAINSELQRLGVRDGLYQSGEDGMPIQLAGE
ncbi:MAG: hypothetical protein M3Z54_01590 [Gemmatimonadota bacterium]|nr:hypothetical protein [Gemmatimonadota bacterium]